MLDILIASQNACAIDTRSRQESC